MASELSELQNFLRKGDFLRADELTSKLVREIEESQGLSKGPWRSLLPSRKLQIIDGLWVKHTDGRFGFTAQRQVWEALGGRARHYDIPKILCFEKDLGWTKTESQKLSRSELNYSLSAPPGHLPARFSAYDSQTLVEGTRALGVIAGLANN